jgi:hypothetical protein
MKKNIIMIMLLIIQIFFMIWMIVVWDIDVSIILVPIIVGLALVINLINIMWKTV